MGSWRWTAVTVVVIGALLPNLSAAQSQPTAAQSGQSDRVSVVYVPPKNFSFQEVYDLLRQHNALEKIGETLSSFRFPEQLERISAGLNRDSAEDLDRRMWWH
jgi:hypothetical protein